MITKKQIKTANYDHKLTIMGIKCKGATITVDNEEVLISVCEKTDKLIHSEIVAPVEVKCDWSLLPI